MPTPNPDTGTQYIEIADFSPGIYSEQHAATAPRYTAADSTAGALVGPPGIAQVDGTERCHADKTGSLVPLPAALPTGIRDWITPADAFQPTRPYRYVLDAQLGPLLADGDESLSAAFQQFNRQTVQMMWGYYLTLSGVYKPVLIGREYYPWITFPPANAFGQHRAIADFMVAAVGLDNTGTVESFLPSGSLARGRFYYGFTNPAFGHTQYSVTAADNIFVGLQAYEVDEPIGFTVNSGSAPLVNGTIYYVIETNVGGNVNAFKISATQGGAELNITSDGAGTVARKLDRRYRPYWMVPVSVALAGTPWARWGAGNRWTVGTATPAAQSFYGFANPENGVFDAWSPAIGLNGRGTTKIAMQIAFNDRWFMPWNQDNNGLFQWFYHYGERGNVPQTDLLSDIAGGPLNPYMLISHQGRVVFPDRRRTLTTLYADQSYGFTDDLFFYSAVNLPCQNFLINFLNTDRGETNSGYDGWPAATQEPYNSFLAAEDVVADVGTIGVVTVDQMLIVKHKGGGALVSGDLDNPTINRLPYIESTGGVICKGAPTPVGYVYGSPNGIFMWSGGDNTQKLSPQLDGFFWNHTDGSDEEQYAGSRGRMGFWNGFVCVPNNYLFDIETQSWWRFSIPTLAPLSDVIAPFNCYDTDDDNLLYAWPYRHTAVVHESYVLFPDNLTTLNVLSVTDPFTPGPSELDIRFCIDNITASTGTVRTICGQWDDSGLNSLCFLLYLDATDHLTLVTSIDGVTIDATAVCSAALSGEPILGRVTWDSGGVAGEECKFYWKGAAGPIRNLMGDNNYWTQLGTPEASSTGSPLGDSVDALTIGNESDVALNNPLVGSRLYALSVATSVDSFAPAFAFYPHNLPDDPSAASFEAETGQTVTVTHSAVHPIIIVATDPTLTPPVWYTFNPDVLDTDYTWQSHPIVLSELQRSLSIQNLQLTATSASATGTAPTITATLRGYSRTGALQFTRTNTVTLALDLKPQLCRVDVIDNPVVDYVTIALAASDPNGNAAPKIHNLKYGFKTRAIRPRHGNA